MGLTRSRLIRQIHPTAPIIFNPTRRLGDIGEARTRTRPTSFSPGNPYFVRDRIDVRQATKTAESSWSHSMNRLAVLSVLER